MARYTYPADELETLHGKAGLNKIAKRMGELFERMGWVSSPDDVQWELVTWGVFDLKFEHPGDPDDDPGVVIYMAPTGTASLSACPCRRSTKMAARNTTASSNYHGQGTWTAMRL